MLIYIGVVLLAGGPLLKELLAIVFIFFSIQYGLIISLEEQVLRQMFKNEYINYCLNVPRFFPSNIKWISSQKHQLSLIKTFKTEKRTLQNIGLIIIIIIIKPYFLEFFQ